MTRKPRAWQRIDEAGESGRPTTVDLVVRLYHTTTTDAAGSIERVGFEDRGYRSEQPCTWWSTTVNGHPSDPAVFVVDIPDDVVTQWLNEDGSVPGKSQMFSIPARIVNNIYGWKRLPDRPALAP